MKCSTGFACLLVCFALTCDRMSEIHRLVRHLQMVWAIQRDLSEKQTGKQEVFSGGS